MPTRLLLEGPTIEDVLARVRAEHGPAARIVHADKVRSGGIGGFFAKERYEVQVEVDEADLAELSAGPFDTAPPAPRRPLDEDAGLGILGLLDDADAGDEVAAAPAGFGSRAAAAYAAAPAPAADEPLISTDSPSFARLLAALSRDAELLPDVDPQPEFTPAPFRSLAESVAPEPVVDAAPEPAAVVEPGLVSEPAVSLADAVRAAGGAHHDDPAETPEAVCERARFEAVVADAMSAPEVERTALVERVPAPAEPVIPTAPPGAGVAALARVGVPQRLLDRVPETEASDVEAAATWLARRLPGAAPCARSAGTVVVVIGEGHEAYVAARALAASLGLGLDADAVVLASRTSLGLKVAASRYVDSRASLLRRLPRWRAAEVPTVVAVDAGFDEDAAAWAREVVEMLSAETVWALVDASRKTDATAAHLARMEAVDALVVTHAAGTATPGEVLGLNIPVALVDGEQASPARWAELLVAAAKEDAR